MSLLVDVQGLDFAYGEQLVLKQIHLPIEAGSALGLIGPNGGGKTTLIRLLLGQFRPTRGQVRIDGISPQAAVARGNVIGYLPQNYTTPANFPISVRQTVRLGLVGKTGLLRRYARDDLRFVDWLIERVGLADLAERPVGAISGGQQQRVLIARALAPRPKLLLLDEPTTGIDRAGQRHFLEFLHGLKTELGLTIILVSHDLATVASLADRIACLNVTLHYHDVPRRFPERLAQEMFGCSLDAMGIIHEPGGCAHG